MMFKNQFYFYKLWFKLASCDICRRDGTRVYVGLLCDGRKVAVKRMENHQFSYIRKEVEMLVALEHPNILSYMVKSDIC